MTLNASGPISLAGTLTGGSIASELALGATTQISLNCTSVRTLAGVPSGAIIMPTNFYGKANQYTYTVSANQTNFCMRAGAVTAGWNGTTKLVVNINSGVIISSNGTGTPAMTISGSYPNGVTVTNNGTVVGKGGNGANRTCSTGASGSTGGIALKVLSAVTFNNVNVLAGGGGGGGSGGTGITGAPCCRTAYGYAGGGGGGRSSNVSNSSGGSPGGSAGTYSSAGGGGTGANCTQFCRWNGYGGNGGTGGTWGAAGASGALGGGSYPYCGACSISYTVSGGAGGGGGKATCGAGTYITWTGTGTRYGSIS